MEEWRTSESKMEDRNGSAKGQLDIGSSEDQEEKGARVEVTIGEGEPHETIQYTNG